MSAHNIIRGIYRNKTLFSPDSMCDKVFIPYGSEKGDCTKCKEGVLFRNSFSEKKLNVQEAYTCDVCGRDFIEGINVEDWVKYTKITPRRYFIEVVKDS